MAGYGSGSPTRGAGWHGTGGLSPTRNVGMGASGGFDIFGSVEASDDAVWNSKTVSGWLNRAASPRQRRRFNEVYSSLASFKERNRGDGTRYPRVPEVGSGSLMGGSTRLNALHAGLPGMGGLLSRLALELREIEGIPNSQTRVTQNSELFRSHLASIFWAISSDGIPAIMV